MSVERDPLMRGRGMAQRNLGLKWLRNKFGNNTKTRGVVYFADDDNIYDLRLFEKIRQVRNVGIFPVAFTGGSWVEQPKVENGTVTGIHRVYTVKYILQPPCKNTKKFR